MCSCLHGHETSRYPFKCLLHRFRCRRNFLFQNDFACFIQNTVERPAIAEVHTNRQLVPFENHVSIYPNSASLFHSRSPFLLRLERVEHWERIASRGDRPSHPICPFRAFRPAEPYEKGSMVRSPRSGSGEVEFISGEFEAVHLSDPERACLSE